jgi:hypothetical protein
MILAKRSGQKHFHRSRHELRSPPGIKTKFGTTWVVPTAFSEKGRRETSRVFNHGAEVRPPEPDEHGWKTAGGLLLNANGFSKEIRAETFFTEGNKGNEEHKTLTTEPEWPTTDKHGCKRHGKPEPKLIS